MSEQRNESKPKPVPPKPDPRLQGAVIKDGNKR